MDNKPRNKPLARSERRYNEAAQEVYRFIKNHIYKYI